MMRRREFLSAVGGSVAGGLLTATLDRAAARTTGEIPPLAFDSAGSLLDADGTRLRDDSFVAVWAGETATNTDSDGSGDAVSYDDRIPMVAVDGDVLGFGGPFVTERDYQYGNEEFLLNALDEHVGEGRVAFDEGHGQFYDLAAYGAFEAYAENNGYTVEATTDLAAALPTADALVVTSPSQSFTASETDALRSFLDGGGALCLFHQSDFNDFDETANLNAVADALDLGFRFNDDQVTDDTRNAGENFQPVTDRFTGVATPYLDDREGIGLEPGRRYRVDVTDVTDGDTVTVEFDDGRTEDVRVLGIDTPETPENERFEREQEWEGIDSLDTLTRWGTRASAFGKQRLGGKQVTLFFDENSDVRDQFGRLLGYIEYDDGIDTRLYNRDLVLEGQARVYGSGHSKHDDFAAVEAEARAAGRGVWGESDFAGTDPIRNDPVEDLFVPKPVSVRTQWGSIDESRVPVFAAGEATQSFDGDDLDVPWLTTAGQIGIDPPEDPGSPGDSPDFGNPGDPGDPDFGDPGDPGAPDDPGFDDPGGPGDPGDDPDFGNPGDPGDDPEAPGDDPGFDDPSDPNDPGDDPGNFPGVPGGGDEPIGGGPDWGWGDVSYQDIPLAGLDEDANVGAVGGLLISEEYEAGEDYAVDTSEYGNFAFLTNLLDYLAHGDRDGDVLIDGGHGQFGADYALSNEDAAYYGRYLEGFDVEFDQRNDLDSVDLDPYRAVIVTTPAEPFTFDETTALREFARDGGAVVLMGASTAPSDARARLNDLARELETDLRLNGDSVEDRVNNVNGDPTVITTTNFDDSFPLLSAYDGSGGGGDAPGGSCGDQVERTRETGTVAPGDQAAFTYEPRTDRPCGVTVSLSGSERADLDLYITRDGSTPSPTNYDRRSWTFGSEEEIELDGVAPDATLGLAVSAFSGTGEFTLVVEERG